MLFFKILDAVFLVGLMAALYWVWKHLQTVQQVVTRNNAMPREASRGLVYGFVIILIVGAMAGGIYFLF